MNTNDDEELYKARDSRTLVMDSVLADLDFAIKYLPEEQYHNRISHWTALAFKSRICLYEGTWRKYHPSYNLPNAEKFIQESFNASKELVDKGPYKLYTTGNPVSDYRMLFLFTTAPAEECILSLSFPQDQTGGGAEYNYFFTDYSNGNHGATRSLIEDYFMVDGTSFNVKYSEAEQETMSFADEMKIMTHVWLLLLLHQDIYVMELMEAVIMEISCKIVQDIKSVNVWDQNLMLIIVT